MVSLKYSVPESFLQEETRNGYMVTAHMKQVWAVQLDLLQELLRVCNEHGLKVFADSGTLIGAVRDHGFIPWDDDIDMCMLRED
ncbi:MAG: LicD family protein, partial [Bacteroidales bacterium]|nr:LicD family protein [Bacteroidales bacterium]